METTVTPPPRNHGASCHENSQNSGGFLSRRRQVFLAGGAFALALGLALSQHWVTLAALAPLFYILPCAFMMMMCMKGMGRNPRADQGQDAANAKKPVDAGPEV